MNFTEVKALLFQHGNIGEICSWLMGDDGFKDEEAEAELESKIGKLQEVHSDGFYDGYNCEKVFLLEEHGFFLRIKGYYTSYNGTDWDRIDEVFPHDKMIVVYTTTK